MIKDLKPKYSKSSLNSKKLAKYQNRHLIQEDTWMANQHMKSCSTSYVIKELQIQTTMQCHYILIRMTKIK